MPCKGSILTEWNGAPARPVTVLAGGARPATAWAAGGRPASQWAGCELASLQSISPDEGARASSVFVILTGSNFGIGSTVIVSGYGIVVSDVIYGGPDILVATFTIAGDADLGDHDVQVQDGTNLTGAVPFTVLAAAWPSATAPNIWLEADYGVTVGDDDLVSVAGDWQDRGPNAIHPFVGPGKGAPAYREQGFGGQGLPFIKFDNAHGLTTVKHAALSLTTSTTFIVGMRNSGDANSCIIFEFSNYCLGLGIQDAAASWYVARPNLPLATPPTQLLESSYNNAFGHIPKGSRFILRHQFKGSHATNKMFLNGVETIIGTQLNNGINANNTNGPNEIRIGFRDASLPGLDLDGQIAAVLQYIPALSDAEALEVEAYLQKWLATVPMASAGRGPILLQFEDFGVCTVTVSNWAASGVPVSFGSAPSVGATYVILTFSQPIRRFGMTNPFDTGSFGVPQSRLMVACDSISPAGTIEGAHDAALFTNAGQREYVRYDPGFTTVIIRDTISNFHSSGVVTDARFWMVGEF